MEDLMKWWAVYLPADLRAAEPERPEGTDLVIWRGDNATVSGKPIAYGFQGKARKPVWNYSFKNIAHREEFIANKIAMRRAHFARKADAADKRKNYAHDLVVGDLLSASWGYDQTNVDFYEVIEVVGPKSVILCQVAQATVSTEGRLGSSDSVAPEPGNFVGSPMLKRVNEHGYVRVTDCSVASKWSGRPMHQTSAYAGH